MANTEGKTYEASWKRDGKNFAAWLKRRPREKVTGANAEELIDQLWEIALDAFGDGEACINLVPPLPVAKGAANYFEPPWFAFSCNEAFQAKDERATLFRGGTCSFCGAGLGGRNETERVVDCGLKHDLGFVSWALPGATVVSEALLKFLRARLGDALRAIPCRAERRVKQPMWEVELAGQVPLVCHKHGEFNDGVVCPKCETARFGSFVYEPVQKGLQYAVSRADLARMKKGAAVAFAGETRQILVDADTAAAIKSKGLKGVLLKRVALLPPEEIGGFKVRKLKRSEV